MCAPFAHSRTSARRWPRHWGEGRARPDQHARRCNRRERPQSSRLRRARPRHWGASSCCSRSSRSAAIRRRICLLHRGLRSRVEAAFALVRDQVRGIAVYVGYPEYQGDAIYNSAALVRDGQVLANHRKVALPNYAVFDEKRYFHARRRRDRRRSRRRQARTDHLRGRLGARTVPRACGRRRRGHSRHQRLAVSPCAAASARAGACDAGAGKRAAADLRQHGRRPRRARVRRRLGRRRRQGARSSSARRCSRKASTPWTSSARAAGSRRARPR